MKDIEKMIKGFIGNMKKESKEVRNIEDVEE